MRVLVGKMETIQEIETKIMGILSVKSCRGKLSEKEEKTFNNFNNKYRDENGHLIKGSFFVGSDSKWKVVK